LLTRSYRRVSKIGQQSPTATACPGLGSAARPKPPPPFSGVSLLSRAFLPLAQGTRPSQRLGGALANPFGSANDLPVTLALVLGTFHAPIIASWPQAYELMASARTHAMKPPFELVGSLPEEWAQDLRAYANVLVRHPWGGAPLKRLVVGDINAVPLPGSTPVIGRHTPTAPNAAGRRAGKGLPQFPPPPSERSAPSTPRSSPELQPHRGSSCDSRAKRALPRARSRVPSPRLRTRAPAPAASQPS
jgi:hypothetical protein